MEEVGGGKREMENRGRGKEKENDGCRKKGKRENEGGR